MCNQARENKSRLEIERSVQALMSAGLGLTALGNLLGADCCEHSLDEEDKEKLAHAVVAIGELVRMKSYDIYSSVLEEDQPAPTGKE